jgi:hypothetical protein
MSLFIWGFIKCIESREAEIRDKLIMDGVDLEDRERKTNYEGWQLSEGDNERQRGK